MGKGFNSIGNSGVQIVTSGPDTTFDNIKNVMFKMINGAKKFIYIQTPYFIPDTGIMDALKTAILSGVNVNIMIPSKPDHISKNDLNITTNEPDGNTVNCIAKVIDLQRIPRNLHNHN